VLTFTVNALLAVANLHTSCSVGFHSRPFLKKGESWLQVQKRFRDWAGLLESYQVLLVDEGTEDVPVEVPAEQVCMHFFPGSRVDIKGAPAQQVGSSLTVSPAISEWMTVSA